MRNNSNLAERLQMIWSLYFNDVPISNQVQIMFGRKARKRLGSIREKKKGNSEFDTVITINGYFKDKNIPELVVDATIAHELCHYTHGFASPLPQLSPFPHKGGAVDKEMVKRGLGDLALEEKAWLDENWLNYLKQKH